MVGASGFEPETFCTPSKYQNPINHNKTAPFDLLNFPLVCLFVFYA